MKGLNLNLFSRLKQGLAKTRDGLVGRIQIIVRGKDKVDDALISEIEEVLIEADVGVKTTERILERLRENAREMRIVSPDALIELLKSELAAELGQEEPGGLTLAPGTTTVIMVVGVNGTGKTTTAGKLAYKLRQEGKRVILGAADTFRAAAIEQLEIWGNRAGAEVIRHQEGSDPAAVAYDAIQAAKSRGADVLIIDTAGRLHTKSNLMEELKKVRRVINREIPGAPHEVLLTLDATAGQNAIAQARIFTDAVGVTGIALTKLDGTAKGGVIISIRDELGVPVKLIGIGEGLDDLRDFAPREFVEALFAGMGEG